MWFSGFFFLILSLIVEVYLWWKLQASLIFLSGRTCTIGGWLNTFLPHCIYSNFIHYKSKFRVRKIFLFLKDSANAHKGCRCWSKIHKITLWNIITILKNWLLFEYMLKCNLFLWSKAEFSASLHQCQMMLQKSNSTMLICSWNMNELEIKMCYNILNAFTVCHFWLISCMLLNTSIK